MSNTTVTKDGNTIVVKSNDATFNNTVVVKETTTSTITVNTSGPQGIQGPAGISGTIINTSSYATTGSNTFVGNQTITGSITFNDGAQITPTLYGNFYPGAIDIVAGPGNTSYASLTSNNTQSYIFVNNDGAYVQTSGGTYQFEFRDDGYFVLPQVQSLTKQAGILSAGDIIIQADEARSWRFSSGSGILYAPGGIEALSFTGSLKGTASIANVAQQSNVVVTTDDPTNNIVFSNGFGTQTLRANGTLVYNSITNTISASTFRGNLVGNSTGTASYSSYSNTTKAAGLLGYIQYNANNILTASSNLSWNDNVIQVPNNLQLGRRTEGNTSGLYTVDEPIAAYNSYFAKYIYSNYGYIFDQSCLTHEFTGSISNTNLPGGGSIVYNNSNKILTGSISFVWNGDSIYIQPLNSVNGGYLGYYGSFINDFGLYSTGDNAIASYSDIGYHYSNDLYRFDLTTSKHRFINDVDITGSVNISNGTLNIGSVNEIITLNQSTTSPSMSFDFNASSIFYLRNQTSTTTYNIINVPTTSQRALALTFVIDQGSTGYSGSVYQFNGSNISVKWVNGIIPTGSANKTDVIGLTAFRSGSSWNVLGSLSTFS